MPFDVTFLEWLHNGTLGPLRLGLTRSEIHDLLGSPEQWGGTSRRRRKPDVYKWGHVELHFHEDVLFLLYTDDFDGAGILHGGSAFHFLDAEQFTGNMTPEQLQTLLDAHGIAYSEKAEGTGRPMENSVTDEAPQLWAPVISRRIETRPGIHATFHWKGQGPEVLGAIAAKLV